MSAFQQAVRRGQIEAAQRNEIIIRKLLGRWVSELDPAVAYDQRGNILGLTIADAPIGARPFVLAVD